MATMVWIRTKDGRTIHGISYSVSASNLPTNPAALAATMPGGMTAGVYHIRSGDGWVYIPTNQVVSITVAGGAST